MIVLHAGVWDNDLYLWGETPLETERLPRRGRHGQGNFKNPGRSPELYPYDAGTTALCSTLRETGFSFKLGKRSAHSLILRLPTVENQPLPSSPLIGNPPEPKREAILFPWKIFALRLSREQAVEFICACMGKQ